MTRDERWREVHAPAGCMLCEGEGGPPVAVCRRCGAFVCREHALRLTHYPARTPVGLAVAEEREKSRWLEVVCEVCYLNGLQVV